VLKNLIIDPEMNTLKQTFSRLRAAALVVLVSGAAGAGKGCAGPHR
jgi:hypothetical protein